MSTSQLTYMWGFLSSGFLPPPKSPKPWRKQLLNNSWYAAHCQYRFPIPCNDICKIFLKLYFATGCDFKRWHLLKASQNNMVKTGLSWLLCLGTSTQQTLRGGRVGVLLWWWALYSSQTKMQKKGTLQSASAKSDVLNVLYVLSLIEAYWTIAVILVMCNIALSLNP